MKQLLALLLLLLGGWGQQKAACSTIPGGASPPHPPPAVVQAEELLGLWHAPTHPLHPFLMEGTDAQALAGLLFAPLTALLEGGVTRLAETRQAAPQMVVELTASARWGDGSPLLGEDVVFTWQLAQKFRSKSSSPADAYHSIEKLVIDPSNPRRLTLTFSARQFTPGQFASLPVLPKHLETAAWEASKGVFHQYLETSNYCQNPALPGLYNGAYLLVADQRPQQLLLKRHPQGPRAGRLRGEQLTTVFLGEKNGALKLKNTLFRVVSEEACEHLNCRALQTEPYRLVEEESRDLEHLDFNLDNPLLRSLGVRQALVHAIDRQALYRRLDSSSLVPTTSFLPLGEGTPKEKLWGGYDPLKAAALLEAEGWLREAASGKRFKGGKPLSLELLSCEESGLRKELSLRRVLGTFLVEAWAKLGVTLTLKELSESAFRDQIMHRRNFTGVLLYAWHLPRDGSLSPLFHSQAVPSQKNPLQGQNLSAWFSRRVDKLLDELDAYPFSAQRGEKLAALSLFYQEQLPGLALFFYKRQALVREYLTL